MGRLGPEVGWGPVELRARDDPLFNDLPDQLTVLHWHGDTYERPPGAVLLATNATYREQAFRCGPRAWGLQFHIEVDRRAIDNFLQAFGDDVAAGGTTPDAIAAASSAAITALTPYRTRVLERFARLVAADEPLVGEQGRLAELA